MDLLQSLAEDEDGRQLEARWNVEVEDFSVSVGYILTVTDSYSSFWPFGSYLANFGPFNMIFDQLRGFSVEIAY